MLDKATRHGLLELGTAILAVYSMRRVLGLTSQAKPEAAARLRNSEGSGLARVEVELVATFTLKP